MRLSVRNAHAAGLFLGIALLVAGTGAALLPASLVVTHGPAFYRAAGQAGFTREKVSLSRARFYGGCVAGAGLLLVLASLWVPGGRKKG